MGEEHIMARLLLLGMVTVLGLGPGVGMAGDLTPREIYEGSSPAVVMILGYSHSGQQGKRDLRAHAQMHMRGSFHPSDVRAGWRDGLPQTDAEIIALASR